MATESPTGGSTALTDNSPDHCRDTHVARIARADERARRLMQLPGVGPTTATSALVAMIGNRHDFSHGRQLAAWLGLVRGQYSSGGKARLGHISKAGDGHLRLLLVMGARAVLNAAKSKTDSVSRWATALEVRRGYWRAVVALAAKNARMAWAVLRSGESFVFPGLSGHVDPSRMTEVSTESVSPNCCFFLPPRDGQRTSTVGAARGVPDQLWAATTLVDRD